MMTRHENMTTFCTHEAFLNSYSENTPSFGKLILLHGYFCWTLARTLFYFIDQEYNIRYLYK